MPFFRKGQKEAGNSPVTLSLQRVVQDGLLPSDAAVGRIAVDRQLPPCSREWGRLLDTKNLLPGDLLLFRSINPDRVSSGISSAQAQGGLAVCHAQWTHAAVYLGDGEHICESTFKERGMRWGVNIRSVHHYCNKEYAIRARRPIVTDEKQRISIAVGAMARLSNRYNFFDIIRFKKAAQKGLFRFAGMKSVPISTDAVVCSTLYQDALSFSFHGLRSVHGFAATPAHLSASTDFEAVDPALNWIEIL